MSRKGHSPRAPLSIIACFTLVAAAVAAQPVSSPARARLELARGCLREAVGFEARFTHEVIHPLGASAGEMSGRAYLRSDGRFRLEYTDPPGRLVIHDGKALRTWNPETKLATVSPLKDPLVEALLRAPRSKKGKTPPFTVRRLGEEAGPMVVELLPSRRHREIARIVLVLDDVCPAVRRLVIAGRDGVVNRLTFEDVESRPRLPGSLFRWRPPKGARVVSP